MDGGSGFFFIEYISKCIVIPGERVIAAYTGCRRRLPVLLYWMQLYLIKGFVPDRVRVISCGFPAPAAEQDADASACVRLELLMVSVIS